MVAAALEERWDEALKKVAQCEKVLATVPAVQEQLSESDKVDLLALSQQLETVWYAEETPITFKKQIARALIHEIIADIDESRIKLVIYWQGDVHTQLEVKKNKTGQHSRVASEDTKMLVKELSRYLSDPDIASLLTRLGKKTGTGLSWTQARVCAFRNTHHFPTYKKNEHHNRGELLVAEVCERLSLPYHKVLRLIKNKQIPAKQVCTSAPWVIKKVDVDAWLQQYGKFSKTVPLTHNRNQQSFDFSIT